MTIFKKYFIYSFICLVALSVAVSCSGSDNSGGDDDGGTNPSISLQGSISSFGDVSVGTDSNAQSIILNSSNLMSDVQVSVTGSDFSVSLDNTTFSSSLSIPFATANQSNQIVYVRFSPSALGSSTGELKIENADVATITRSLSGIGIPVTHNYTTFTNEPLGFGGGLSQSAAQSFTLHNDVSDIETIKMYLQIACPATGCDDWDRFANVKVKDPATGNWFEIGRYITPYWVGTQQLQRGLEFDVTDFKSLLTGSVELRIYIENWTTKTDLISVDFDYIEGTPDYPYYAVAEVLSYHNSSNGVPYGVSHAFDLDKDIAILANAESTHLRTVISGWGHATPYDTDGRPCAEWCFRSHDIKINNTTTFTHNLSPIGCASNPINNQSPGNWTPDRAGWCPGMAVPTRIDTFTSAMAGNTFSFEYDYEDWTNDMSNGNAFYATSTYVVVKSNTPITAPIVN